jgi:tubulin polyglutamylase TTLL1
MSLRWRSDSRSYAVVENLSRRGWTQCEDADDSDWDINWASVTSIRQIFGNDQATRLLPGQLINHFPNHYELTRKVWGGGGVGVGRALW